MSELEQPRIANTSMQVGHGGVFISWHGQSGGFGAGGNSWRVHRVGHKTDPDAPWYLYGDKTFYLGVSDDARKRHSSKALEDAKAWASERYGIKTWKRNRLGDYIDADKDYPEIRR